MSRASKVLVVVVVVSLGLWGCARKPPVRGSQLDRLRDLEKRCVKLEQDYKRVAQARDQAQKDAKDLKDEVATLRKQIEDEAVLMRERDDLRKQVAQVKADLAQKTSDLDELRQQIAQKVTERDALQGRCERLKKGLQSLLTQEEGPFPPPGGQQTAGPNVGG
jgi:chromosome segregation ATPase